MRKEIIKLVFKVAKEKNAFDLLDSYYGQSLQKLWETGKRLSLLNESEHDKFEVYWNEIDKTFCQIIG
jgi:hypothetical protein